MGLARARACPGWLDQRRQPALPRDRARRQSVASRTATFLGSTVMLVGGSGTVVRRVRARSIAFDSIQFHSICSLLFTFFLCSTLIPISPLYRHCRSAKLRLRACVDFMTLLSNLVGCVVVVEFRQFEVTLINVTIDAFYEIASFLGSQVASWYVETDRTAEAIFHLTSSTLQIFAAIWPICSIPARIMGAGIQHKCCLVRWGLISDTAKSNTMTCRTRLWPPGCQMGFV